MITLAQIDAEAQSPTLTDSQVLALTMLVKQYERYRYAIGIWPNLADKLAEEQTTATVKTQALKAVLTQLETIPALVVETSGNSDAQSFFSTKLNWDSLAQDVLDTLYDIPVTIGPQNFAIAQRTAQGTTLKDSAILREEATGRIF